MHVFFSRTVNSISRTPGRKRKRSLRKQGAIMEMPEWTYPAEDRGGGGSRPEAAFSADGKYLVVQFSRGNTQVRQMPAGTLITNKDDSYLPDKISLARMASTSRVRWVLGMPLWSPLGSSSRHSSNQGTTPMNTASRLLSATRRPWSGLSLSADGSTWLPDRTTAWEDMGNTGGEARRDA
jgi:hypothetical protein